MSNVDIVAEYLPLIRKIDNPDTAEAVAKVWMDMLELSIWDDIGQARFFEGIDNVSLVSHVNSVTESALAVSRIINKYHGIEFDEQKIIVFGLLHDVDKMINYVFDDEGKLVLSDEGQMIQHGVMSAILAYNAGFDTEMLHLILTHTTESVRRTSIKEGILFGNMDKCDWEMASQFIQR